MDIWSNLSQLLSLLERNNTVERKKAIFFILNKLKEGDSIAVDPLIKALCDGDHYIRIKSCKGLGIIRDKRGVEALILALEDNDIEVKVEAANALGNIGDPRAVEPLCRILNSPQKNVRKAAKCL